MSECKWEKRFLLLAHEIATWSKDNSTKVGAVIIGKHRSPKSFGYNGMPRGIDDSISKRSDRPEKYFWYEHAERNAIYNAEGSLEGCTIYVTHYPCPDCARAIIQKNITRVVVDHSNGTTGRLATTHINAYSASKEMLEEAGIAVSEIIIN